MGFPLNVLKILYPAGEGSNSLFYADDFFREIVSMVPEGCRITIISDSCHSGGLIEQAKEQIGNSFLGCPIKEQAEESTGEEEDGQEKDGLKKKSVPFSAVVDMLKQKTGREEVSRSQMTPALSEILGEQSTLRGKGFFQKLLGRTEDVCAGEPEKLEEVKAGDVCEEEAEGEVDAGEEKVEGEVEAGEEEVEGEVDAGEEEVGGEVEAGEEEVEGEVEAGEEEVEGEVDAGEEEVEGEVDAGEEEVEGEVDAGEANEVPPANGVLISGCQTHQYSADANPTDDPSDSHGALTHAILTILAETEGEISNRDLVIQVRNLLVQTGYDQEPGLYCTDELADAPFIC